MKSWSCLSNVSLHLWCRLFLSLEAWTPPKKAWLNVKEAISIPNQAFNLLDAFQKQIVVRDVAKVLLVQAWDALHISVVALAAAGCQSSREGCCARAEGDSRAGRAVLPSMRAGARKQSMSSDSNQGWIQASSCQTSPQRQGSPLRLWIAVPGSGSRG